MNKIGDITPTEIFDHSPDYVRITVEDYRVRFPFILGDMVRHEQNGIGVVQSFTSGYGAVPKNWPMVRYESGYVYTQNPAELVKGHYIKTWVDDE